MKEGDVEQDKPMPIAFSNVEMHRTRGDHIETTNGVTLELSKAGDGSFIVTSLDGTMSAFIQPDTVNSILQGLPVTVGV